MSAVYIMKAVNSMLFLIFVFINCVQSQRELPLEDGLIIGGKPVSIRQYPYAVIVVSMITENRTGSICEGSILSTKYVLTAGHCLARLPFKISVLLGSTMLLEGKRYNTTLYKIHPLFNGTTVDYDIGLVVMETAMIFDGVNSKPVVLATEATILKPGSIATVIGWGIRSVHGNYLSPRLQAVQLKIVNSEICRKLYTRPDGTTAITPRMFCLGDLIEGGKDNCNGDSGGPAVDSTGVQIGIISWGNACARIEFPGIYTDLTNPSIRSWVRFETGL